MVKRLRALSTREGRLESSTLLLEGTHLLQEALKTSSLPKEIIATGFWIENHLSILDSLSAETSIQEVAPAVLEAALTTVNPDGVATLFPINGLPQIRKSNSENFVLALDRVQDPGNLGALFRTALAAEIEVVWLALGADPLSQKVLRASSGAVLHLPFNRLGPPEKEAIENLAQKLEIAANRGHQILATYLPGESVNKQIVPYWDIDWSLPTVLVLGNEGSGLHPILKSCCTHAITLPHNPVVESLNVASAAVPLLLERRRAKMTSEIQKHL